MLKNRKSEFTQLSIAMLVTCFFMGVIGRMIPEHFPNLVSPLTSEFEWTRSKVASIFSICAITTGLSGPIVGYLFDRIGPARVYALGFVSSGSGLILAGYADGIWQLQLGLGLFVGFAAACCGNVTNSALVSRWFHKKLPLALAIIFSTLGAGSFLGLTISQILIREYGWRATELTLGIAILALLPVLFILPWKKWVAEKKIDPASSSEKPKAIHQNWSLIQALKSLSFWGLTAVFFATANGVYAVIFQSVTYLTENDMTPVEASFNIGLTGALLPFGMIFCGFLLTKFNINYIALGTYALTMAGIIFLWLFQGSGHYWFILGFIFFFGSTMGARGPIVGSLAARIFGGTKFGIIYGSISIGGGLGAASGAYVSGWIYDTTHNYDAVFIYALICLLIGSTPFFAIKNIRKHG